MFWHAITRTPGENFADGLTTSHLGKPDYTLILQQHVAYVETLRKQGLQVTVLPPLAGFPDAYFVEDPAVVTDKVAVIARPGAPSRRGEEKEEEVGKFGDDAGGRAVSLERLHVFRGVQIPQHGAGHAVLLPVRP